MTLHLKQSKSLSAIEAIMSTAAGFIIAYCLVVSVLPHFDVQSQALEITVIFTAASVVRSFAFRRFFNSYFMWRLFDRWGF